MGDVFAALVVITREHVNHVRNAHHEEDGRQHHGHDVDCFARGHHDAQRPKAADKHHSQRHHDAPGGAKGKPQEGDEQDNSDAHEPHHLAFHDPYIIVLGHGPACDVDAFHVNAALFGLGFPGQHGVRQTVAPCLAEALGVLEGQGHRSAARADEVAHDVVSLTKARQVLVQLSGIRPVQQRPLEGHPAQGVSDRQIESGGRLHALHGREVAQGPHMAVDFSKERLRQAVTFKSYNQEIVVAPKLLAEFSIECGLWMVGGKKLLKVVIELKL